MLFERTIKNSLGGKGVYRFDYYFFGTTN